MTTEFREFPKLIYREPFDDRTAWEVENKGWYSGATVELEDGPRYAVFFSDPVRLTQDFEGRLEQGQACLAEPGLIVVQAVTPPNMERAIAQLFAEHFFDHLTPIK